MQLKFTLCGISTVRTTMTTIVILDPLGIQIHVAVHMDGAAGHVCRAGAVWFAVPAVKGIVEPSKQAILYRNHGICVVIGELILRTVVGVVGKFYGGNGRNIQGFPYQYKGRERLGVKCYIFRSIHCDKLGC